MCPLGWIPHSPYTDGSSPVFYSITHAIWSVLVNFSSTTGCLQYSGTRPAAAPVGSLPSWLDGGVARLLGLPTLSDLYKLR